MQHEIELVRQPRAEVMTRPLALGQIQDTNRTFEASNGQGGRQLEVRTQRQQEPRDLHVVEQSLVAGSQRQSHVLAVSRTNPSLTRP